MPNENPSPPWSYPRSICPASIWQLYLPDTAYPPGRNLLIVHCACGIQHKTESAIGDERIGTECPCGATWSFPVVGRADQARLSRGPLLRTDLALPC
jgi:hypothetical protein